MRKHTAKKWLAAIWLLSEVCSLSNESSMKREQAENNAHLGKCIKYSVCAFCHLCDCIIWVWACICKTTSHDLSILNYPGDTIQNDRYSVQTPKNKRVKLWIQHPRCLVHVYMCVRVEINQRALSHTQRGHARARKSRKGPCSLPVMAVAPSMGED